MQAQTDEAAMRDWIAALITVEAAPAASNSMVESDVHQPSARHRLSTLLIGDH
jgi:hypothetical protein